MDGVKLTIALIIAILLQWTLRSVFEPFGYIDFPLIIIVFAALQRNSIRAIIFATVGGLAIDGLSGGILGASGFSKTIVAYLVFEMARRVYLDNLLLRIPVIAGACLVGDLLYFGVHRLFGQAPTSDVLVVAAYRVIGTTIAGTLIYLLLQNMSGNTFRRRKRDVFTPRRQTRRRNPIRLNNR
jgi:rod shape-determining protein MreD